MNEIVEVFFASDRAYYSGLYVALESCVRHSSMDVRFTLILNEFDTRTERCLKRIRAKENVVDVRVVYSSEIVGLKHYQGRAHFSKMAFARLLMEELYEGMEVKKVLYFDPDIIIHVDVAELMRLEMTKPLMMSDQDNSGVLLIDLAYWRANGLDAKCVAIWEEYGEGFKHPDQDLLIKLFNDKGLCEHFDHSKWNLGSGYWDGERACVIHCIGGRKPWHTDYQYEKVRVLFDKYYSDAFDGAKVPRKGALMSSLSRRVNNLKIKLGWK